MTGLRKGIMLTYFGKDEVEKKVLCKAGEGKNEWMEAR